MRFSRQPWGLQRHWPGGDRAAGRCRAQRDVLPVRCRPEGCGEAAFDLHGFGRQAPGHGQVAFKLPASVAGQVSAGTQVQSVRTGGQAGQAPAALAAVKFAGRGQSCQQIGILAGPDGLARIELQLRMAEGGGGDRKRCRAGGLAGQYADIVEGEGAGGVGWLFTQRIPARCGEPASSAVYGQAVEIQYSFGADP